MAIRVGFIGAGSRALGGHYPVVAQLQREGALRLEAICDRDPDRLALAGRRFEIERRYADYHRMLEDVALDAVYVIMPPQYSLQIVLDCLNAGKHVPVEKPPATSTRNLQLMAEVAARNRRVTAVGFQRRYSPVALEVRRQMAERGPVTMCLAEFHKNKLASGAPRPGASLLLDHIDHVIHAVDFMRYACGGEPTEIHAFREAFFTEWPSTYAALVRFSTGAAGCLASSCTSASRELRFAVHGRGIYAELRMPKKIGFQAHVWRDNAAEPQTISGIDLAGEPETDATATAQLHRHFLVAIETGGQTLSSFEECLGTMRLVEALERA